MQRAFPTKGEKILERHVAYFRYLSDPEKARFRQLLKIFLNEIRIIGIRTEVDDTVRLLVAASAIIPIFGFHDWEYHRLIEVLIYPESFGEKYQTTGNAYENILGMVGMVGLKQLSGVMILSKLSLLAGFENAISSNNLGVPEFARLISHEEVEHGLPLEVPWQSIKHWVQYVADALSHPAKNHAYINDYAYTNEREYLAVLAEYFFKSPEILQKKDPELYGMLPEIFHQDTRTTLKLPNLRRQKYARNSPCPCGSGKKYKQLCLSKVVDSKNVSLSEPSRETSLPGA